MGNKYHISEKGAVVICRAKVRPCPLGGGHFDTKEEGERYIQNKFEIIDDYETHINFESQYGSDEAQKRGLFVEQEIAQAIDDGLMTKKQYFDEDTKQWSKERQIIHDEIISELHEKYKKVPQDKKVIFSAGLPGAGKTTVLTQYENLNMSEWATVSSDDIKEMLAEKGHVPEIEGLTPMEASTLVHEESSMLADRLLLELSAQGKNIIYDFTCKKISSAKTRMAVLTNHEYKHEDMQFVFVDISPEIAKERAKGRYLYGLNEGVKKEIDNKYLDEVDKKPVLGGRHLPERIIDECKPHGNTYSSINAENIIELHNNPDLNSPVPKIYNNVGTKPIQINYESFKNKQLGVNH